MGASQPNNIVAWPSRLIYSSPSNLIFRNSSGSYSAYTFNPDATIGGYAPFAALQQALAFSVDLTKLYSISASDGSSLPQIQISDSTNLAAITTLTGPTNSTNGTGDIWISIAIDPTNNTLYLLHEYPGTSNPLAVYLATLNPTTGAIVDIGVTGLNKATAQAIFFDNVGNLYVGYANNGAYAINKGTAVANTGTNVLGPNFPPTFVQSCLGNDGAGNYYFWCTQNADKSGTSINLKVAFPGDGTSLVTLTGRGQGVFYPGSNTGKTDALYVKNILSGAVTGTYQDPLTGATVTFPGGTTFSIP